MTLACLLCGNQLSEERLAAKDFITNVPGVFIYRRCPVCGSYTQDPIPSQAFLNSCYESQSLTYKVPQSVTKPTFVTRSLGRLERHLLKRGERRRPILPLIALVPKTPPPAKLLEIGCGYGHYLNEMKTRGYEVAGVELNTESCRNAATLYGLNLVNQPIEELQFSDSSFDIVTASMLLEHLRDPRKTLEQIHRWLKTDGELLISLPLSEGMGFDRFRQYCYVVQPPYHICLPSMEGIRRVMGGLFEITKTQCHFSENDVWRSASYAKTEHPTAYNRFFSFVGNYPSGRVILRSALYRSVQNGEKTSRVSVRLKCVK